MNIQIEQISNGFIVLLGNKKIFCDVPEAVCGVLAEWALAECENSKEAAKLVSQGDFAAAMQHYQQQLELERALKQTTTTTTGTPYIGTPKW